MKAQTKTAYRCTAGHQTWNNPKACVTIVLLQKDQVLCAERGVEPKKGQLDFPGGFLEYGEQPWDGVRRELAEETGLTIQNATLIGAYTHEYLPGTTATDLIYLATSWQGEMAPRDDVHALTWKPITVIESSEFAWQYPGLVAKLKNMSQ